MTISDNLPQPGEKLTPESPESARLICRSVMAIVGEELMLARNEEFTGHVYHGKESAETGG